MKTLIAVMVTLIALPLEGDMLLQPHKHCTSGAVITKYTPERGHKNQIRAVYITTFCKSGKRVSRWA